MGDIDAQRYGRSFADVYDTWYPEDDTTAGCVQYLAGLSSGGPVLELGVGTGRIALRLAALGLDVTGIDASEPMLDILRSKDPRSTVRTVTADLGTPTGWPEGPFDLVVAVCNLLCNITDPARQAACIATAATRLRPGGHLVVEAFEPAPLTVGPQLATSEVHDDHVVLIATDADPDTAVVTGQHIELRDGEPPRLRPWRIRATTPQEIDRWTADVGLSLVERRRRWGADGPPSDGLVSVYRRD